MKKIIKKVFLSLLLIAGIALALPFSPLRKTLNSTLHTYSDNTLNELGVNNIKNQKIAKVIGKMMQNDQTTEFNIVSSQNARRNIQITNNNSESGISSPSYLNSNKQNNVAGKYAAGSSQPQSSSRSTNSGNAFFTNSLTSSQGKIKSANSSVNSGGFVAISTDLSQPLTNSTKQMGNTGPPPDGGGIDIPPSLPVGDGTTFMLLLALMVSLVKFRKML